MLVLFPGYFSYMGKSVKFPLPPRRKGKKFRCTNEIKSKHIKAACKQKLESRKYEAVENFISRNLDPAFFLLVLVPLQTHAIAIMSFFYVLPFAWKGKEQERKPKSHVYCLYTKNCICRIRDTLLDCLIANDVVIDSILTKRNKWWRQLFA